LKMRLCVSGLLLFCDESIEFAVPDLQKDNLWNDNTKKRLGRHLGWV
jgi:hypothetical protein